MGSRNLVAGLLAAVAVSGAVGMAASAHADPTDDQPSPTDQAFLQAIKAQRVPVTSDDSAIDLAHSTCQVLIQSGSVESALRHVKNETGWTSAKDIGAFGSFAVQGYCPSSMPKQQ
jgi:hypothetical protein